MIKISYEFEAEPTEEQLKSFVANDTPRIIDKLNEVILEHTGICVSEANIQISRDTAPTRSMKALVEPPKPCNLALTALEKDDICPACKCPAGDHVEWKKDRVRRGLLGV